MMLQRWLAAKEDGQMAGRMDNETGDTLGKGVGGVAGATTGAAIGSLAGPVGTAIGGIAGLVGGWWAGEKAADAAQHAAGHDDFYRQHHSSTSRGVDYERTRPAYHLGHVAGMNPDYQGRSFDEIEPDLRAGWTGDVAASSGDWNDVRDYARDAYARGQEQRITLAEEQLAVGTREVQAGEVSLRKRVDTNHVEQEVELIREEVTVERRPLSADARVNVDAIGEQEIRVPVMREEAVVEKRTVPIEEVVVNKKAVSETETVQADLRKETLDIDEDVDTRRNRTDDLNTGRERI
jgi:uncharacterized protein (TIGR02271 family)